MWPHKINLAYTVIFCLAITQLPQAQAALKCLQCNSKDTPKCITDLTSITATDCANAEAKFCTTSIDANGIVTRGCAVDITTCTAANCQSCTAEGCNKPAVCKTCDSSKDPTCSQTDGGKDAFNTICEAADTQCLINVKADKQLERKCATAAEITACTNAATCKKCNSGGNCNVGIFPEQRLQCYQCPSTDSKCGNVALNSNDIVSKPCLLYVAGDKCYTFGTSATTMARGCVSDISDNNKCTTPDANEACSTCTKDQCNNSEYERVQTLKCIQCASTDTDATCKQSQTADSAKDCQKKIPYNKSEYCYTQAKGGAVTRGCLYDRDAAATECKSDDGCDTCSTGNGCNSKNLSFSCIRCRSDLDPKCRKNAGELTGGVCRNDVTAESASCFWGTWNNVAIRGCLVDADIQMQALCTDDKNKQCETCKGENCNTKEMNGAATMTTITTGLLACVLFTLWRLY